MDASLHIRRGQPADAPVLAAFGAQTFLDTFAASNRASDIAAHLASSYGVAQQTWELSDPSYITLLAESGGQLAAYAQLRRGERPPCVTDEQAIELQRFYVDSRWHGRGVAQRLMAEVQEAARELGGRSVWLSVWERNPRAIAFYAKCGFRDVGTASFVLGEDRQTDRVMQLEPPRGRG